MDIIFRKTKMGQNKVEKFLLAVSGFLFSLASVFGIKIQKDGEDRAEMKESLEAAADLEWMAEAQKTASLSREKKISQAARSPKSESLANQTTKSVIPGKTIKQTKTVTSGGGSSSKTTKSS